MGMYSRGHTEGYPTITFRADDDGEVHRNVNFARQEAEKKVEVDNVAVTLYRIVNGKAQVLKVLEPKMKLELV